MSKTLLLAVSSVFIYFLLLSCNNPTTTEGDPVWDTGTVSDIEGNTYKTIRIGDQWWMSENLRTTKNNDGTQIPNVTDSSGWVNDTLGAYCYYNNTTNVDSINKFGALYNFYVVDTKKLAPTNWHVPDSADWEILQNYLVTNGYNWDGTTTGNKIAKSLSSKSDWQKTTGPGEIGNNLTKNNKSGFSGLPGGYRFFNGYFHDIGYIGNWWCTTEIHASDAYSRSLHYNLDFFYSGGTYKNCGVSVRLVKD